MSAPSYMVPPQYTSTPQPPQPPQLISPVEQAILDLTKLVDDVVEEQKKINAQLSQKIDTMENNVNKGIDGLQSEMEHKLDNLQCSISKLAQHLDHLEEESQEEECQSDTMAEKKCQQQPHEELIEDFIELSEGFDESSDMCDVVLPRENQEEIIALLTEEGSETKAVEVPKKNVLQKILTELNPTATTQATKNPLPVAPSTDQVYILPASQSQHKTPEAPTIKSNPSLVVLQNIRKLVANIQAFATTSKTQAVAYIAWHSGWFGCRFGFGAPEPRHL